MCFGNIGLQSRIVADKNFICTEFTQFGSHTLYTRTKQNGANFIACLISQFSGRGNKLKAYFTQGAVSLFCNYIYSFCHFSIPPLLN